MSVNTYLTSLSSELVLTEDEKSSISTSIYTLKSRIDSYFGGNVLEKLQFGSSTRGTILPRRADRNSDIDYMVVFDTTDGQKKPQTYLDRLKKFTETKYSTSEIYQSNPVIALSLNHITFELVPAIQYYGYQIPSPSSYLTDWISTDPVKMNQDITDKNKAENYHIKPLVRLIKYWNAFQGHLFYSYGLEEWIISHCFYSCSSMSDYFYDFWLSFNCSSSISQKVKDKIESAKKHASQAKQYEKDNMPCSAENEIKKIVPSL